MAGVPMDVNNIRELAERIIAGTEEIDHLLSTAREVAEAYLSEHLADDDEPLQNEWLYSVIPYGSPVLRWDDRCIRFEFEIRGHNVQCSTRGDVRRLLRGLAIEPRKPGEPRNQGT